MDKIFCDHHTKMADRLVLVSSNIGVGNASSSSSAVYSLTPGQTSLSLTKDSGVANVTIAGSLLSNHMTTDILESNLVQTGNVVTGNLTIDNVITTTDITVSNSIAVADIFRVDSGNVALDNDAYIQKGTNTFSATSLVGRSNIHTDLLAANTIVADGINVVDAIRNVMKSTIRYYVKTTGDDSNDGRSWDAAFQTVNKAASVAGSYSTIYIESGDYVIQNPIHLNKRVSVIGDNLRSTRIFPQNPKLHFFFVDDLCYIAGLRFMNHRRPAFCVSFACCIAEAEVQFEKLSAINVLYSPTGYTTPPTVVVEAPESSLGKAPTATVTLNGSGQVDGITIDTSGDLYPGTTPQVTIGEPQLSTGIQPSVSASISGGGSVNGFNITTLGTPYIIAPTVTIDAPASGVRATATATLDDDGYLDTINVGEAGSGYTSAPGVNVSAPPSIQATATVVMNFQGEYGVPVSFNITNPGSGYSVAPTVSIDAPESVQATAEAVVVNGVVDRVEITNPGSGYTNIFARPHISIPPPSQKRAFITGSPYIQNCSSITGSFNRQGDLITTLPPYDLGVYDVDETGAGGGCLVDGWVLHTSSPLRSLVGDSFTQVNQGGPGHLVLNLGYAQFVSCFTTFCSYSYRAISGGTINISTSVTDFGTWGLVSTGFWDHPIATGGFSKAYRSAVASVTIPDGQGGTGYTSPPDANFSSGIAAADVILLADRVDAVLVTEGGAYEETPTVTFIGGGGSGASGTIQMTQPNPVRLKNLTSRITPYIGCVTQHRGVWHTVTGVRFVSTGVYDISLYPAVFAADPNESLEFFQGSTVSTGQHVMEYAGSGTTYNALLEYGGQPNDGNQVYQVFPGRVFYCITDHSGNQSIGPYFGVEQLTGAVTLNTDKFSLSGLEAIGPFKRDGNPAGVKLVEVSNDIRLIDSKGVVGGETAPTQNAVKEYVDARTLKPAGVTGSGYVKNSNNDYDASWIPVVLESQKAQPLGVANLDSEGRIVGDGSIVTNLDASALSFGTVSQNVLPTQLGNALTQFVGNGVSISHTSASNILTGTLAQEVFPTTIGNTSTQFIGNGAGISSINGSNVSTGSIAMQRVGTGTATGFGNVVLSTSPSLEVGMTITGPSPTITFQDTEHNSGFIHCDSNLLYVKRGPDNSTTWTQVDGQWPFIANLSNNDCTVGGNLNAIGDVAAYASDSRLKTNLQPISTTPLADVQTLRGVRFDWNPETPQPFSGTDVGLVAQDVQKVLPEAVKPAPFDHSPKDGSSISGHEYLTIDSGNKVTALLVECIKELHAKVQDLEARVDSTTQ